MSLAIIYSRACIGMHAPLITIEVHISNGLPCFQLVGLPQRSVSEAKERVRSAMINAGFEFPAKRITVNLSPADIPKTGARFDLPIALGLLVASGQIAQEAILPFECVGELALSGELRAVAGVMSAAVAAGDANKTLLTARANQAELALLAPVNARVGQSLLEIVQHVTRALILPRIQAPKIKALPQSDTLDMADVMGQDMAIRALTIAAAGGHNVLLFGPPGTGKTMLAKRFNGLLPSLNKTATIEHAMVLSVAGKDIAEDWGQRPFRQPHHGASSAAMIGGGRNAMPGEVSLAHCGTLFLDELPEFNRTCLDALREPLESGDVHLARADYSVTYPARFQLIAAMNPSPTGSIENNRSTFDQTMRYLHKVSGPLLERIDIQVEVKKCTLTGSAADNPAHTTEYLRQLVQHAQNRQLERQGCLNDRLSARGMRAHATLSPNEQAFIAKAVETLGLSLRVSQRLIKIARTIADLDPTHPSMITQGHLAEALQYRAFDRFLVHYAHNG